MTAASPLHLRPAPPGALELRAWHEAGHAVVALLEGFELRRVTIARRGDVGGSCEYRYRTRAQRSRRAVGRTVRAAVAVALAGSVAQDAAALGRGFAAGDARTGRPFAPFAPGSEDDARIALRFTARLHRGAAAQRAYLRRMRRRVERVLDDPVVRTAVAALARALLRDRTMTGPRATAAVGRAVRRAGGSGAEAGGGHQRGGAGEQRDPGQRGGAREAALERGERAGQRRDAAERLEHAHGHAGHAAGQEGRVERIAHPALLRLQQAERAAVPGRLVHVG